MNYSLLSQEAYRFIHLFGVRPRVIGHTGNLGRPSPRLPCGSNNIFVGNYKKLTTYPTAVSPAYARPSSNNKVKVHVMRTLLNSGILSNALSSEIIALSSLRAEEAIRLSKKVKPYFSSILV